MRNLALASLLVLSLVLAACSNSARVTGPRVTGPVVSAETAVIEIDDAWVRPAEQGGTTAVYFVIRNNGQKDEALHDVAAPAVTDEAMLHESKTVDNIMTMEHVHQIDVPAGESVTLKPGGLHIMLMDVKEELQPGDSVRLVLYFENFGEREFEILVRDQ